MKRSVRVQSKIWCEYEVEAESSDEAVVLGLAQDILGVGPAEYTGYTYDELTGVVIVEGEGEYAVYEDAIDKFGKQVEEVE